MFMQIIFHFTF